MGSDSRAIVCVRSLFGFHPSVAGDGRRRAAIGVGLDVPGLLHHLGTIVV